MNKKQGISLIVLVLTIVVIVILATAVILSIANNNPIDNANKAVEENNKATLKEAANLAYLDWYSEDAMGETTKTPEEYVKESLEKQGFSSDEIKKVKVTEDGVTVITFAKNGELVLGNEVTASNGEEFYVIGGDTVGTEISSSTQNIILFSKYNLKKENGEITLKQDKSEYSNNCVFSSTNYWSSVEGIAYPDSETGKYPDLNDEEKYPIGSGNTSVITKAKEYGTSLGVTGRLMTKEEVGALRTNYSNILFGKDTPKGYLIYWLGSAYSDYYVWYVDGDVDSVNGNDYDSSNIYCRGGVRPVITVSKSLIK